MFMSVIGHSEELDASSAAADLIAQCKSRLHGKPAQAGILLASSDYDLPPLLSSLNLGFPALKLVGATTDGEMSSELGFSESSAVLQLFSSDTIEFTIGVVRNLQGNCQEEVAQMVQKLMCDHSLEPSICLTFPESLGVSGSSVVNGLRTALGEIFPIFGGSAGDGRAVVKTYQFYNNEVLSNAAPVLFMSGPLKMSFGRVSGWLPIGKQGIVTDSEGALLKKIDNRPATQFLSDYLGEIPPPLGVYAEYPFVVEKGGQDDSQIGVISADVDTGYLTCLGDIPQGSKVTLSEADRDMIIAAASSATSQALKHYTGSCPATALVYSCAGRKAILGTRVSEEIAIVQSMIPNLSLCGFYTYGEIAPAEKGNLSHFNNEMFVVILLGEE